MIDVVQNSKAANSKSSMLLLIVCTGMISIFQSFSADAIELFRYENTIIKTGEWWRLLTGHFFHLSWSHLLLNLIGMWVIIYIFHPIMKPILLLASVFSLAIGTSLGLLLFRPDVGWYVGLSGLLHGFIIVGAIVNFRSRPRFATLILSCVSVKLVWEQFFVDANAINFLIGGRIIYDAHSYGAISGIILTFLFSFISYLNRYIKCHINASML